MQDIEKILRHPFSGVGGLFNDIEDVSFVPTCVGLFDGYHLRGKENAVHPHVRGVNDGLDDGIADVLRFIPTCVGVIRDRWEHSYWRAVHPHVRGVNNL